MSKPYFLDECGSKITYEEVAKSVEVVAPHLVGAHIFQQLESLGLLQRFQNGETPHSLPYSFSES